MTVYPSTCHRRHHHRHAELVLVQCLLPAHNPFPTPGKTWRPSIGRIGPRCVISRSITHLTLPSTRRWITKHSVRKSTVQEVCCNSSLSFGTSTLPTFPLSPLIAPRRQRFPLSEFISTQESSYLHTHMPKKRSIQPLSPPLLSPMNRTHSRSHPLHSTGLPSPSPANALLRSRNRAIPPRTVLDLLPSPIRDHSLFCFFVCPCLDTVCTHAQASERTSKQAGGRKGGRMKEGRRDGGWCLVTMRGESRVCWKSRVRGRIKGSKDRPTDRGGL